MSTREFIEYYVASNPQEVGTILKLEKNNTASRDVYFMYFPNINMCGSIDGLISFDQLVKKYTSGENTIHKFKLIEQTLNKIESKNENTKKNQKMNYIMNQIISKNEIMLYESRCYIPKNGEYVIFRNKHTYHITKFGELVDNTEMIFDDGLSNKFSEKIGDKLKLKCKTIELKLKTVNLEYKVLKKDELESLTPNKIITLYHKTYCVKNNNAYDIHGMKKETELIRNNLVKMLSAFKQSVTHYSELDEFCCQAIDYYPEQFNENHLDKGGEMYVDSIAEAYINMYYHVL